MARTFINTKYKMEISESTNQFFLLMKGRINMSSIILGKNIAGKNVTLNDIWNDEKQKNR